MKMNSIHETDIHLCFRIKDITLLPHYAKPGIYVGPGYPEQSKAEYTAKTLLQCGARRVNEALWARPKA